MYIYIYICVYVHVYIHVIYIYIHIYIYTHVLIHHFVSEHPIRMAWSYHIMCMCMCMCVCACMCACLRACVRVYVCVYVCMCFSRFIPTHWATPPTHSLNQQPHLPTHTHNDFTHPPAHLERLPEVPIVGCTPPPDSITNTFHPPTLTVETKHPTTHPYPPTSTHILAATRRGLPYWAAQTPSISINWHTPPSHSHSPNQHLTHLHTHPHTCSNDQRSPVVGCNPPPTSNTPTPATANAAARHVLVDTFFPSNTSKSGHTTTASEHRKAEWRKRGGVGREKYEYM